MNSHLSQLADIEDRIEDARHQLHEQQSLIAKIDNPQNHTTLIILLSNGLRVYCWLEDQKNALMRRVREYLPLPRQ
jgi:hypothetical protein